MISVLVTGANGQLGQSIKSLKKKDANFNLIYTDYLELDICDLKQVQDFFKSNKAVNYCINCAAYTAVDKAEVERDKAYQINTLGAKNLALACNKHKVVLIHISTDFVFDGKKREPYLETDVAEPISVYGASKLQGEIEIKQFLAEHFIIRTSWLYSEYGNNFMKTMLRLAETRDEISVVSDQTGTPTYAGDLAEVIAHIMQLKSKKYGTYHYSCSGETNWYDFSKAIFKEKGIKINVNPINTEAYPTPAERPMFSVLSNSKIKETFNIVIPFWKDSLAKCIRSLD